FASRRRHTRSYGDWSSDVCSSDLILQGGFDEPPDEAARHTRTGQQERPSGHAEQVVRAGCHGDVASQAAVAPCVRERSRQEPSHSIEVLPYAPRRGGIDATTLECRVAHEAAPLTAAAANEAEHPFEERSDLTP